GSAAGASASNRAGRRRAACPATGTAMRRIRGATRLSWSCASLRGDLVVTAAVELQQAPTMPEGIGELHDAAPAGFAHRAFLDRAGGHRADQGLVEVVDHDIGMDRRPMAQVVARGGACADRAGVLVQ